MTHPVPARNLELKVGCDDAGLARVRARLEATGLPLRTLVQVDTYFAVPSGRLKLREIAPAVGADAQSAELIAYTRPDRSGPRWSAYHRVPVAAADAKTLKAALAGTVGVLTEVVKTRTVGLRGRTRIHLDEVRNLGAFVELETVVVGEDDGGANEELAETAAFLGLDQLPPISGSYNDLMLAARASPSGPVTGANGDGEQLIGHGEGTEE